MPSVAGLEQLASLLERRNDIDEEIAALIGRPAIRGHVGEWIAREIFRVALEESAVHEGFDGRFSDGPLAGKTVNVKWYGKREGVLDINPDGVPDYYLVMTGPKSVAMTSRGQTRPLVITEVFLFDAPALVERLHRLGVRVDVATSVRQHEWETARVYPVAAPGARLTLTGVQREALKLFAENRPVGPSAGERSTEGRDGQLSEPNKCDPHHWQAAQPGDSALTCEKCGHRSELSRMSRAVLKSIIESYRNRQGDASADEFAAGIIFVALRLPQSGG